MAQHHIGVKEIQQRTLADGVVLLYRSYLLLLSQVEHHLPPELFLVTEVHLNLLSRLGAMARTSTPLASPLSLGMWGFLRWWLARSMAAREGIGAALAAQDSRQVREGEEGIQQREIHVDLGREEEGFRERCEDRGLVRVP